MTVGLQIRSAFELDRPLSDSALTATYRGVESRSKARVALKILRVQSLPEHDARRTEALAQLERLQAAQVPGLARIYDFGTTDSGDLFLSSEWHDGRPLSALERPRPAQVLLYALQTTLILRSLADHQLTHLNVRPENLFVREDGQLELTGLGTGYLLPPGGVTRDDPYWAPELDAPPRGLRPDQWSADLYALARTTLDLLRADVSGAGSRVPHIRLPEGLESAIDGGPELCLTLEECLHQSVERRPASYGRLLDVLERCLAETGPAAADGPLAEENRGETTMKSLRDMWTEGLSDVDLQRSARNLDRRATRPVPAASPDTPPNVVLAQDEGEVVAADQDLTREIVLPDLHDTLDAHRRGRRVVDKTQPPPTSEDHEIEEILASLERAGKAPAAQPQAPERLRSRIQQIRPPIKPRGAPSRAAPASQPPARAEPAPSPPPGAPVIDWTRPGYAAKASSPTDVLTNLPWREILSVGAVLLILLASVFLWRLVGADTPEVSPPLRIDTSEIRGEETAVASEEEPPGPEPGPDPPPAAPLAARGTEPADRAESTQAMVTETAPPPEPEVSTPLEALVADLPEQIVPPARPVADAPVREARRSPPEPQASEPSPRHASSSQPAPAPQRPTAPTEAPRSAPARADDAPQAASTKAVPPAPRAEPAAGALRELDRALLEGDPSALRGSLAALSSDQRAEMSATPAARRTLVFAEIALENLRRIEDLLRDRSWEEALEKAQRFEQQFPALAGAAGLRGRAATGLEARAEQLAGDGELASADAVLRDLRRLWPERQGLEEKLRALATRRRENRQREVLAQVAAAARAERPHEALEALQQLADELPADELARRTELIRAQLARLDAAAPRVVLDPFEPTTFVRDEPLELHLQIEDDYEVRIVELRLRATGRAELLEIPLERTGGRTYRARIGTDLHGNRKVGIWVRAWDRSGNIGELGSARRLFKLKPRRPGRTGRATATTD